MTCTRSKSDSETVQVIVGCTYTVRYDVGVTVKASFGVAVVGVVAGKVPYDEGFVAAGGEEHVRAACELSVSPSVASDAAIIASPTSPGTWPSW